MFSEVSDIFPLSNQKMMDEIEKNMNRNEGLHESVMKADEEQK